MIFANIVMIILYNKGVLGITELLNPQIGNNQVPESYHSELGGWCKICVYSNHVSLKGLLQPFITRNHFYRG